MRLVDADEVYKVLTDYYHHKTETQHEALKEALSKVPTVDAEPVRHGQWVHNKWSNMRHDYSCSLCGCRIEGVDPFSLSATTYNYCPECGAVMDGVEE